VSENCANCDRADCDAKHADAALAAYAVPDDPLYVALSDPIGFELLRRSSVATANCLAHAVNWRDRAQNAEAELDTLRTQLASLQATDAACGEIHLICADAGIEVGNVVERVRALAGELALAREMLATELHHRDKTKCEISQDCHCPGALARVERFAKITAFLEGK